MSSNGIFPIGRLENYICQSSRKLVPVSNQRRIRQRKEGDGFLLSHARPKLRRIPDPSQSLCLRLFGHGKPLLLSYKYSFHKKLGLRLATNYSRCLLNKPLHISKADTKIFIGGFQAKMRGAGFIPFLG